MSFKITHAKSGVTMDHENVTFNGYNFVDDQHIVQNNRSNLEMIEEWIKPAQVHDQHAIIISAGPTLNFDQVKAVMKQYPNHKVICVKHSYHLARANDVVPWGCLILDTRTIHEVSTLGHYRAELLKDMDQRTTCFLLTRAHPDYTIFLQRRGVKIVGFHNHYNEVAQAFGLNVDQLKENKPLYEEISKSLIELPGSCAAIFAVNLGIFLGFRNFHLFGLDGSVTDPKDSMDFCHMVECNGKKYWVPNEFVSYGIEMKRMYEIYPKQLNANFWHYGDSFLSAIYHDMKISQLNTFEHAIQKPYSKTLTLDQAVSTMLKPAYFNRPTRTEHLIIKGLRTIQDYQNLQLIGLEPRPPPTQNHLKHITDYLKNKLATKTSFSGICHGSGSGQEQQHFQRLLASQKIKAQVIGTELNNQYVKLNPDLTVNWDFHQVKPEWVEQQFDFIYSNSFNHTYQPDTCIDQWMRCLKPDGFCFIEWDPKVYNLHTVSLFTPFVADESGYRSLFSQNYRINEQWTLNDKVIFVISHHSNSTN